MIPSKTYDVLKPIAQIWLPALGTLYFTLAAIWGLPAAEQVVGTIVAVDTFLGVLLGISSKAYNNSDNVVGKFDGDITVFKDDDGREMVNLAFNQEAGAVLGKDEVLLKVKELPQQPRHAP